MTTNDTLAAVALAALLLAPVAHAHVNLQVPDGGERIEAGGVFLIVWNVHIQHNTVGWHLHYSVDGGNWQPIVMNLPPGNTTAGAVHTYLWNVPNVTSSNVLVRVTQDNTGTDYIHVSFQPFAIVSTLTADTPTVSLGSGGTQNLTVDVGPAYAGHFYGVIGSLSGIQPGVSIANAILPLNLDIYSDHTIVSPNTAPLFGSTGNLDAAGTATASFVLPAGSLPPQVAGFVIWHAAVVLNGASNGLGDITNPTSLTFAP